MTRHRTLTARAADLVDVIHGDQLDKLISLIVDDHGDFAVARWLAELTDAGWHGHCSLDLATEADLRCWCTPDTTWLAERDALADQILEQERDELLAYHHEHPDHSPQVAAYAIEAARRSQPGPA